jgi:hypothetical protein
MKIKCAVAEKGRTKENAVHSFFEKRLKVVMVKLEL